MFENHSPKTTITFLDSGASDHFFCNRADFSTYEAIAVRTGKSALASEGDFAIVGKGTVTKVFKVDGKVVHLTFRNAHDVDIFILWQFPTDQELRDASQYGLAEAVQLLKLLGVDAKAMLQDYKDPEPVSTRPVDAPKSRPPNTIVEWLALYERVPLKSLRDDEVFEACEMAIAADSVDQSQAIAALPDSTDECLEQLRTDIQKQLTVDISDSLRPGVIPGHTTLYAAYCLAPVLQPIPGCHNTLPGLVQLATKDYSDVEHS
ncbi:hypothetical protein B0H14DRAFT_3594770 [Mycena olivaceomarginata]|nr:hypothetical protein B0H14DRAFT_3594770 [Mycena olivaceomarginata]